MKNILLILLMIFSLSSSIYANVKKVTIKSMANKDVEVKTIGINEKDRGVKGRHLIPFEKGQKDTFHMSDGILEIYIPGKQTLAAGDGKKGKDKIGENACKNKYKVIKGKDGIMRIVYECIHLEDYTNDNIEFNLYQEEYIKFSNIIL